MVEEILGKNKSLKTTQMRYFQGSDLCWDYEIDDINFMPYSNKIIHTFVFFLFNKLQIN